MRTRPTLGEPGLSPYMVRVLLLYSHPLMGEGLGRMLSAEPGIELETADMNQADLVTAALSRKPEVVIVEEGGAVDAADIVRRTKCAVVLDVDITTTQAWALCRESFSTRPDDFIASLQAAVARVVGHGGGFDADIELQAAGA